MIAALLLVISLAALAQFALFYWRAVLAGVAAQPLSEQFHDAAQLGVVAVQASDFNAMVNLHDLMTPELKAGNGRLRAVRMYYRMVDALNRMAGKLMPQVAAWSEREMATCTKYVAVRVDQRMARNLECAAALRSY